MKIKCYCDSEVDLNIKDSYDLTDEIIQEIEEGSFLSVTCESCSKVLKPEVELNFKTPSGKHILFIPENERYTYEAHYKESDQGHIIGYAELLEYVTIIKNKLDQKAIEIIKLHIIQKAEDPSKTVILLDSVSENQMHFHIHGIKENEVGLIKIPISLHEKILLDLSTLSKEEPYASIIKGPYISLRKHIEREGE